MSANGLISRVFSVSLSFSKKKKKERTFCCVPSHFSEIFGFVLSFSLTSPYLMVNFGPSNALDNPDKPEPQMTPTDGNAIPAFFNWSSRYDAATRYGKNDGSIMAIVVCLLARLMGRCQYNSNDAFNSFLLSFFDVSIFLVDEDNSRKAYYDR